MATTVLDLITFAMQLIGSLQTGEVPSADDAQLGMTALNAMLDGWNTERLNLYTISVFSGNLLNAQQVYAMGPAAADFNTLSPILIQTASVIIPATTVREKVRLVSSEEWAQLTERGLTGYMPDKLYCDYLFPIANLYVHPIPNHTIALELYLWSILAQFVNLTDAVAFRPGYLEALQYNLALKLAPIYGYQLDPQTAALAGTYKQRMQQLNTLAAFPVPAVAQAAISQQQGAPPAQ